MYNFNYELKKLQLSEIIKFLLWNRIFSGSFCQSKYEAQTSGSTPYRTGSTPYRTGSTPYRTASPFYRTDSTIYRNDSTTYTTGSKTYRPGSTNFKTGSKTYRTGSSIYRIDYIAYRIGSTTRFRTSIFSAWMNLNDTVLGIKTSDKKAYLCLGCANLALVNVSFVSQWKPLKSPTP